MRCNHPFFSRMFRQFQRAFPDQRQTRLFNLAYLVGGIVKAKSVSIPKMAGQIPLSIKPASITQRLWRFLDNKNIEPLFYYRPFCQLILNRFQKTTLYLILDRCIINDTHNILWVGVFWRKRALPLCFLHLRSRQGNSNQTQRQRLLEYVFSCLSHQTKVILLADREFQSVKLMQYLQKKKIHYVIRVRSNVKIYFENQSACLLKDLPIKPRKRLDFNDIYFTKKQKYLTNLLVWWQPKKKKGKAQSPWFLVTNLPPSQQVVDAYRKRFGIEALFSDMKKRGFHLEDTRLENHKRIERLLLGVAIACTWVALFGEQFHCQKSGKLFTRSRPKRYSIFKLGIIALERLLILNQAPSFMAIKPFQKSVEP